MQKFDVDIETDSLLTVNALHKGQDYNLEVGDVLNECRFLLLTRHDLDVMFVNKQANKVAHLLARAPYLVNCHNIFMSTPDFLLETLMYDLVLS